MIFPVRRLPVIQNWSCHSCGNCCKEYYVTVTAEERRRIEQQGWAGRAGFEDGPLFIPYGPIWRREYRLRHRADGSCIFLDERGLCRIHAEFGEPAKPIACQLYPYMLVPAGKEMRVSVRFSCPSVVRNMGRSVVEQASAIRRYAQALIPPGARPNKPPPLRPGQQLEWPALLHVADKLESLIAGESLAHSNHAPSKRDKSHRAAPSDIPLPQRMLHALSFARLLEQARVDQLDERRQRELVDILAEGASAEQPLEVGEPAGWARMLFRLIVAQCARKDLSPHLRRGLRGRWGLLRAAIKFARGRGPVPKLQPLFGDATFDLIEQPLGGLSPEAGEMLERYYRIKLGGLQFFGAPFYRVPLIEGFYSLALTLPAILWIARWLAVSAGRSSLSTDDVAVALTVVDHQWGFAEAFGFGYARRRVRMLATHGQIERLIMEYAR